METSYTFERSTVESWPRLAWLARAGVDREVIEVQMGAGVEATDDFFCEAVWVGEFDHGDFDQTELVFGSGGRRRTDGDPMACRLARPHGVCAYEGVLYVTDSENHRVRALEGVL